MLLCCRVLIISLITCGALAISSSRDSTTNNAAPRRCISANLKQPLKHEHLSNANHSSLNITLQTSDRPSHQLITNVLKILIQDVFGFENVTLVRGKNTLNTSAALDAIAGVNLQKMLITLIRQIEAQNTRIAVVFLGDKLETFVRDREANGLPVLFFDAEPSVLTSLGKFKHVTLEWCAPGSPDESCAYTTTQISKVAWAKLADIAPEVFRLISKMNIEQEDYRALLRHYGSVSGAARLDPTWAYNVSCDWLNNNEKRWLPWIKSNEIKRLMLGGVFPLFDEGHNDACWGVSLERAARIAVNAVNNNASVLAGYRLLMHSCNGACAAAESMYCFVSDQQEKELIGVVGPACSDAIEPLLAFGKFARVLMVSYGAEASGLGDQNKYPYFYRTIPDNLQYGPVYANIMREIGWGRVAAVSEDGQKYPEYLTAFQNYFKKLNIDYSSYKIPRGARTPEQISDVIKQIKSENMRIIIGDFFERQARAVLCAAYRANMTAADGYVWFIPNWLSATWYKTTANDTFLCTTEQMLTTINYHFTLEYSYWEEQLETKTVGDYTVRQFRTELENDVAAVIPEKRCQDKNKKEPYKTQLHKYAGYAHDAVWAISLALDRLSRDFNGTIPTNEQLTRPDVAAVYAKYFGQLEFPGVSGHISFNGSNRVGDIIVRQRLFNPQNASEEPTEVIIGKYEAAKAKSNQAAQTTTLLTSSSEAASTSSASASSSSGYNTGGGTDLMLSQNKIKWGTHDRRKPSDGGIGYCLLEPLRAALGFTCERTWVMTVAMIGIIGLIIVCAVMCMFVIRYSYTKKLRTEQDTRKRWQMRIGGEGLSLAEWEMPRTSIHLNRKLGQGAFGVVYGGEAILKKKRDGDESPSSSSENKPVNVAVKTLIVNAPPNERLDFLAEAETMKRLNHENIIKLYGVCTEGRGPFSIVLEFMLHGDLKTYLLNRRDKAVNEPADVTTIIEVGPTRLTSFARDVASGLQYLHSERLVHRDLAARNCLVSVDRRVKLSDFGLCRPVYENGYYRFTRKAMMPVRWMSPESLDDGVFAPSSDVWGLGVVFYEIATLGGFPFPGRSNAEVLEYVKRGGRLTPPEGCTEQLHLLLLACWEFAPQKRPTVADIVLELTEHTKLFCACVAAPAALGNEAITLDGHANVGTALTAGATGAGGGGLGSKHHQKFMHPSSGGGGDTTDLLYGNKHSRGAASGAGRPGFISQRSEPAAAKVVTAAGTHVSRFESSSRYQQRQSDAATSSSSASRVEQNRRQTVPNDNNKNNNNRNALSVLTEPLISRRSDLSDDAFIVPDNDDDDDVDGYVNQNNNAERRLTHAVSRNNNAAVEQQQHRQQAVFYRQPSYNASSSHRSSSSSSASAMLLVGRLSEGDNIIIPSSQQTASTRQARQGSSVPAGAGAAAGGSGSGRSNGTSVSGSSRGARGAEAVGYHYSPNIAASLQQPSSMRLNAEGEPSSPLRQQQQFSAGESLPSYAFGGGDASTSASSSRPPPSQYFDSVGSAGSVGGITAAHRRILEQMMSREAGGGAESDVPLLSPSATGTSSWSAATSDTYLFGHGGDAGVSNPYAYQQQPTQRSGFTALPQNSNFPLYNLQPTGGISEPSIGGNFAADRQTYQSAPFPPGYTPPQPTTAATAANVGQILSSSSRVSPTNNNNKFPASSSHIVNEAGDSNNQ